MVASKQKFYIFILISCLVGYIWLLFSFYHTNKSHNDFEVCLIKHVTNIPCPSCGSTRSVLSIFQGRVLEAFFINPIGLILALTIVITPVWAIVDLFIKAESLFLFYKKAEVFFRRKSVAIPAVILILSNWIWNIYKEI